MPISGAEELEKLSEWVGSVVQPTMGDLLHVMTQQGQRMLARTAQFVDFQGSAFHPYNETHPYYYYPYGTGESSPSKTAGLARLHRAMGGEKTTAHGIRFKSYGEFKRALGRLGVDLLGPKDPHMLDAFQIRVDGIEFVFNSRGTVEAGALTRPAEVVTLGIYETKGELAAAHKYGQGRMPVRNFFEISDSDKDFIFSEIESRLMQFDRHR